MAGIVIIYRKHVRDSRWYSVDLGIPYAPEPNG